jgi:hypothetical protein
MTDAWLSTEAWLRGVARDLRIGMLFATRLPLPHPTPIGGTDIARASWSLPVVGMLIGLLGRARREIPQHASLRFQHCR